MIKTFITRLSVTALFLIVFQSCELDRLEAETAVAPGGGTLTTYTAYTIDATDPAGSNVNGRIVFWKTGLDQTLVQISLYNTVPGILHPAVLLAGPEGTGTSILLSLDQVSGDTGELNENKFFLIPDTNFYDSIATLDSHITIYLSPTDDTIVASGNLGIHADPVASN